MQAIIAIGNMTFLCLLCLLFLIIFIVLRIMKKIYLFIYICNLYFVCNTLTDTVKRPCTCCLHFKQHSATQLHLHRCQNLPPALTFFYSLPLYLHVLVVC